MKTKGLLLLITIVFGGYLVGYSQTLEEVNEDTSQVKIPPPSHHRLKKEPRKLENKLSKFFFGFSYIKPIGSYANEKYSDYNYGYQHPMYYSSVDGGVSFEIGSLFWFEELTFLPEKMKLGAMVVYFSPQFISDNIFEYGPLFFLDTRDVILSFKVGPAFSYNLTRNLFLELDLTVEPAFYFKETSDPVLIMRYNPRINLRFRPIYIGIDFSFGRYEIENYKGSINQMRATLGFNF